MNDISFKNNKADYLLAITAMMQPVLLILQLFMIDALYIDEELASRLRVSVTAFPILFSLYIVAKRNLSLMAKTYILVLLVLTFTVMLYPGRWPYMSSDVLKFTLPVVIPVGLCLASVKNFHVLAKCMQYISIFAATIGLLYALMFLSGAFYIEGYSMSFSYSLLFPTFIMINKKGTVWKCIALILMMEMLAIGSRGPLLVCAAYWLFTLIWKTFSILKSLALAVALYIAYILLFEPFVNLLVLIFDSIGINSRTLQLLISDELISHDSGRDELYQMAWDLIDRSPLFGSGVWADRQYGGFYSHNIFLELIIDYGYIGAGILIFIFCTKQFGILRKIPTNHKTMYFMMLGILAPLLVSASYLTSTNLGMFLGFTYLVSKFYDNQLYQDFSFE